MGLTHYIKPDLTRPDGGMALACAGYRWPCVSMMCQEHAYSELIFLVIGSTTPKSLQMVCITFLVMVLCECDVVLHSTICLRKLQ